MATVLIELAGGEGIVRGDDGEIMLTHDVTLDSGQPLQPHDRYQPIASGSAMSGRCSVGLLPPGAVSVEAVEATGVRKAATVGGGTYAVISEDGEHSDPALGYRDAGGAFVHRPMPAEYRHQPVTDAEEPCPVCGAVQYEEYFPTEEWRGGRGRKGSDSFVPSPLIVCRVCGHQEQAGGIMRFGQRDSADEDATARQARVARIRAEQAVQCWYTNKMTLMGVTFPIYAAEGWPARINGQASRGDDLIRVAIAHAETLPDSMFVQGPRIEVTTSIDPYQPGALALARDAYAAGIEADANRGPTDGLSDAALTLWFRAARRRRVARSHQAPVSETEITIDGAREPFLTVGAPGARWVAVRRHHDLTIAIAAREIDPASLIIEPIADPAARLGPDRDAARLLGALGAGSTTLRTAPSARIGGVEEGIARTKLEQEPPDRFVPLRRQLGVTSFGLNQIVLAPGERGRIHRHHNQEEVYLVLEGHLTLLVEREPHELSTGELIRVAPGLRRQLVNRGPGQLVLIAFGGDGEHRGRDGEAFTSWDETTGAPPQEMPLPADLGPDELRR